MTEELVRIPVGDGVVLYGKYRPLPGAPIVVLVHGLTAHMDQVNFYLAARHLESAGFATLRFNQYSGEPDTRKLADCTPSVHARDLDAVLRYVRETCPGVPVAVVGHSLGGLVALLAQEPIDALVLWDAAHTDGLLVLRDNLEPVAELGLLRWRQRVDYLLAPAMLDELRELDSDAVMATCQVPVLVVSASDPGRPELGARYAAAAAGPATHEVIPDSDHGFLRGETLQRLLDLSAGWLTQTITPTPVETNV